MYERRDRCGGCIAKAVISNEIDVRLGARKRYWEGGWRQEMTLSAPREPGAGDVQHPPPDRPRISPVREKHRQGPCPSPAYRIQTNKCWPVEDAWERQWELRDSPDVGRKSTKQGVQGLLAAPQDVQAAAPVHLERRQGKKKGMFGNHRRSDLGSHETLVVCLGTSCTTPRNGHFGGTLEPGGDIQLLNSKLNKGETLRAGSPQLASVSGTPIALQNLKYTAQEDLGPVSTLLAQGQPALRVPDLKKYIMNSNSTHNTDGLTILPNHQPRTIHVVIRSNLISGRSSARALWGKYLLREKGAIQKPLTSPLLWVPTLKVPAHISHVHREKIPLPFPGLVQVSRWIDEGDRHISTPVAPKPPVGARWAT
ncbi:hypothetical protein C8R47DRAFT_1082140 [Mycena vitilis]|nr:hypothetical protein C8R47DRAFT_1082140 [Mycena vitilis]